MIIQRLGLRLYLPSKHLWFRPVLSSSGMCQVDIGISDRGLQDLGDINHIHKLRTVTDVVQKGDSIIALDWDGHRITTADELYHTVWETISGTFDLIAPFKGKLEFVTTGHDVVDEDEVLVSLSTDETSWKSALDTLVSEKEYLKLMKKPGQFNEVEGLYR